MPPLQRHLLISASKIFKINFSFMESRFIYWSGFCVLSGYKYGTPLILTFYKQIIASFLAQNFILCPHNPNLT